MTNEELVQAAHWCPFNRKTVIELGTRLPADDQELDSLLGSAIQARDDAAFSNLLFAALGAGRAVDAHHLAQGTSLLLQGDQLISAAWYMQGDVASALLQAVQTGGLFYEKRATALMMAGIWCKFRKQAPILPEIIAQARILARQLQAHADISVDLSALACLSEDATLINMMGSAGNIIPPNKAETILDVVLDIHKNSPIEFIPMDGDPFAVMGQTIRRDVPAVGRNDPCPCGSGKKYKKCCLEKDQAKAHQFPSLDELQVKAPPPIDEARLTREQIQRFKPRELLRLDGTKIPHSLLPFYFRALSIHNELETAVRVLEQVRSLKDWEDWWDDMMLEAAHDKNRTLIRRLLEMRRDPGFNIDKVDIGARLLLAAETPNPALDLINSEALNGLQNPDSFNLASLGYALLEAPWPALGIVVTRGLMNTASELDAWGLLDALLETRDKLYLSPEDPAELTYDKRFLEVSEETEDESPELTQTRQILQSKNEEMRKLRQKLVEMEKELERKARLKASVHASAAPVPSDSPKPQEAADVRVLRQELDSLKNDLKERHSERNQLRRELQKTAADLDALKKRSETVPAEAQAAESKEELELFAESDAAAETNRVIRLPEFPKKFHEQISALPKPAVQHALAIIGRLAAGDPAAFKGMKRLNASREVCRQRVGTDHRLLFRLHPQTLEIITLINRRDLDRTVRNLY